MPCMCVYFRRTKAIYRKRQSFIEKPFYAKRIPSHSGNRPITSNPFADIRRWTVPKLSNNVIDKSDWHSKKMYVIFCNTRTYNVRLTVQFPYYCRIRFRNFDFSFKCK